MLPNRKLWAHRLNKTCFITCVFIYIIYRFYTDFFLFRQIKRQDTVVYPVKNTKCNVLYIFTFCSILTKGSSEKYTTDIKFIYYTNRTYLFGSILVYGSLLFSSFAHVMKQEIRKGRNSFCFKYDKRETLTSLNRKGNTTDMKIYNSRFLLIFFLNFNIYQAKIMLCY